MSGAVQANVKRVFSAKRITILVSFSIAIFNLWTVVKFIVGRSSFTQFELFASITLSAITLYWINRLVTDLRSTTERRLEETQQQLREARQQADETERRLGEAQKRLEEERGTRLELEKSLAPRVINFRPDRGEPNFDSLKPFAGTQVILESFPDTEPVRAAGHIHLLLRAAGWNVVSFEPASDLGGEPIFDGVFVSAYVGENQQRDSSDKAADELVAWLNNNSIEAMRFPSRSKVPPNTIKVLVGMKPEPYFRTDEQKQARKWFAEFEQRMRGSKAT